MCRNVRSSDRDRKSQHLKPGVDINMQETETVWKLGCPMEGINRHHGTTSSPQFTMPHHADRPTKICSLRSTIPMENKNRKRSRRRCVGAPNAAAARAAVGLGRREPRCERETWTRCRGGVASNSWKPKAERNRQDVTAIAEDPGLTPRHLWADEWGKSMDKQAVQMQP